MNPSIRTQTAILDSSPLLLWLAGRTDTLIIARFKHLAMFQLADYDLLEVLLKNFTTLVTTPHVLTEVSNHARHLKGPLGVSLMDSFVSFSAECSEHYLSAAGLSAQSSYHRFGITDCGLASLSDDITFVTTDFDLAGVLESKGKPVINFNNYRQTRFFHE